MKKTLLLCSAGIALILTNSAFSAPVTGLVASYDFSGNANDGSGNGHNASVVGATLTTDRFGNANSAYAFTGTDYIRAFSGGVTGNSARTVSYWIQTSGYQSSGNIAIGLGTAPAYQPNRAFAMAVTSPTNAHLFGGTGPYDETSISLSQALGDGLWHNIAITYDGSSLLNFYADGSLMGTRTRSPGEAYNTAPGVIIGTWYDFNRYFIGDIDDINIYNRELSVAEIQELSVVPLPPAVLLFGSGLLGFLAFRKNRSSQVIHST